MRVTKTKQTKIIQEKEIIKIRAEINVKKSQRNELAL
jgi:hypothetical protein